MTKLELRTHVLAVGIVAMIIFGGSASIAKVMEEPTLPLGSIAVGTADNGQPVIRSCADRRSTVTVSHGSLSAATSTTLLSFPAKAGPATILFDLSPFDHLNNATTLHIGSSATVGISLTVGEVAEIRPGMWLTEDGHRNVVDIDAPC